MKSPFSFTGLLWLGLVGYSTGAAILGLVETSQPMRAVGYLVVFATWLMMASGASRREGLIRAAMLPDYDGLSIKRRPLWQGGWFALSADLTGNVELRERQREARILLIAAVGGAWGVSAAEMLVFAPSLYR